VIAINTAMILGEQGVLDCPRNQTKGKELSERRLITRRQAEAMSYLAAGLKRERVAELMGISTWTLASHIRHVYIKWHVHKLKEAIAIWEDEQWKYK